MTTLG